jgi:CRP-like cAMP-binding protein
MQTIADLLAEHPFFQGLGPQHLELLTCCGVNVHFAPEAYLIREGEDAAHFYLLRSGRVTLETHAPQRGPIVVETIEAGDVLGWSWLFPPYRWHFSARALEPVLAISLDGTCLRGKCEQDHDLGYELMRRFAGVIVERLQATRLQLLDVYGAPAPARGGRR